MIAASMSLFGFDLFGLTRKRKSSADDQTRECQEQIRSERHPDRAEDAQRCESFFWLQLPIC
ncbi:hypothetical protein EPK99_02785 [Neorhizobium lilium]|uniref:Uncharacterized protein n=1 Tax=Neorhizobium lilium TaxID=2503024 RepID=A0A444LLR1_9HYPH|nr:hypothetical protein [Neorhizobium lilium]RWX81264.1 hypothetical protein EPK99_02785 [Neorhizobium lilium]